MLVLYQEKFVSFPPFRLQIEKVLIPSLNTVAVADQLSHNNRREMKLNIMTDANISDVTVQYSSAWSVQLQLWSYNSQLQRCILVL